MSRVSAAEIENIALYDRLIPTVEDASVRATLDRSADGLLASATFPLLSAVSLGEERWGLGAVKVVRQ